MTTSPLPDLFPHLVPDGAHLPNGTRYAVEGVTAAALVFITPKDSWTGRARWTAEPIPAPRPVPPTEPGTVLLDVTTTEGCSWDRAYCTPSGDDDTLPWHLAVFHGTATGWARTEDLASWTVADVIPRAVATPDPLDETDHRDRIDCDEDLWTWHGTAKGEGHWKCFDGGEPQTLSAIDLRWGPLRFADEVTA